MFTMRSMNRPHPITSYTPLSEAELEHAIAIGTLLNSKWLPISRKGVDRQARAEAERNFARELAKHLTQSNFVLFKGPSGKGHSFP